jgi:LPXTG-motif cell wall-anchored protein
MYMRMRASGAAVVFAVGAAGVALLAGAATAAPYTNGPTQSISTSNPEPGGKVSVSGGGMVANEQVAIELHSTPVLLKAVQADANGAYSAEVKLPTDATCSHELVAVGKTSGRTVTTDIVIGDPAHCPELNGGAGSGAGGGLPKTGAQVAGIALLGAALIGGGVTLRRRAKAEKATADA